MNKGSNEQLGTVVRKHKDWFDKNSMELEELINNRNLARTNMLTWIPRLLRQSRKHAVNLFEKYAENSKINCGKQKRLKSSLLQTVLTLFFSQSMGAAWGLKVKQAEKQLAFDKKTMTAEKYRFFASWKYTLPLYSGNR